MRLLEKLLTASRTQGPSLQGHLTDVYLPTRGTKPFPQRPGPVATTASGNTTYTSGQGGTRRQPQGRCSCPPPGRREKARPLQWQEGTRGRASPSSGLPLHQQLLSAEREPCGSARAGVRTVNSFFQHRLRSKVQGCWLQGWPLCQSVSPRLPQLRSWPAGPLQRDPAVSESRVKVMEQPFFPGLWESHFPRAILQKEEPLDKMSLMHLSK